MRSKFLLVIVLLLALPALSLAVFSKYPTAKAGVYLNANYQ